MQSFIFDANKETPQSLARRRALAQTMAQKVRAPRNVGEGLSALGAGMAGMIQNNRIKKTEQMGQESAKNAFSPILAALSGQGSQSSQPQSFASMGGSQAELPPMPMSGGNSPVPNAYANDRVSGAFDRDALHKSQLMAESGGDPNAVSPVGAQGLMQIMPDTARQPGFGMQPLENPMDPVANEQFGRQYMDKMLDRYNGDPKRALAAYNWGAGNADKWNGDENTLPDETRGYRNYIAKIMGGQNPQTAQGAINSYMPQQGQTNQPTQGGGLGIQELVQAAQNPWLNDGQKSVLNALMEQQFKSMQPQDPMKALQIQKLQQEVGRGGKPWYIREDGSVDPSYLAAKKAGVDSVNIITGEGDKFYKVMDEKNAEQFSALSTNGQNSRSKLAQVNVLEGLLKSSGSGFGATLAAKAGEFGIETEGLSEIQAAQALINKLVPEQRQAGSGPMSDADLALFKQSLPRLINTPEGNASIVQTMRGIAEYEVQMGEIADSVADRTMTPQEGREAIRNLKNPLEDFSKDPTGDTASNALKVGEIVDGHMFKGGDAGNPANWEQVQ